MITTFQVRHHNCLRIMIQYTSHGSIFFLSLLLYPYIHYHLLCFAKENMTDHVKLLCLTFEILDSTFLQSDPTVQIS